MPNHSKRIHKRCASPCLPATGLKPLDIGRSKHHDYYLDATAFERWEYVYDGDNMLVELVGAADS
ncbi:MAG: hypothetical protein KF886_13795 [Candidatus Hydrogenedentes bacterium]|nr:hypothetical protein [Candidatus Hydrogenedentota bacterium]